MGFKKSLMLAVGLTFIAPHVQATEWNVSVWGKRRVFTEHIEKMAELVNEKTNGAFTFNISYGGLSKNRENLDGISIGAFEMAQFCAGYHRDKNPTITVLELPFLGVNTLREEIAVSMAVYNHPSSVKDLERWNAKILMPSPMPQYNLVGKGEAPTKLEDFDGMRVRATGGIGQAFQTIGGVPTSVTATEAYNAMESGVVDTVAFPQHAHLAYRILDRGDWWTTNLNPGAGNCPVVVNKEAYEALSDEHRKALDSSIQPALDHYLAEYAKLLSRWETTLAENKITKVSLDDNVVADFQSKAAGPIRDQWVKQMNAQGLPAAELYQLIQDTLKAERAKN